MAVTSAQVTTEATTLEEKLFSEIQTGIKEKLLLLPLLTDVSSRFDPGKKSFQLFQWGSAGAVQDTLEDGNEHTDGGISTTNQTILCDIDKTVAAYRYDKGAYLSAIDYAAGFFESAPFQHAVFMEGYVAGLVRTASDKTIKVSGTAASVANKEITMYDLEVLSKAMDEQLLPKTGRRLILPSAQYYALIRNAGLTAPTAIDGASELRNAFLNRLYGFDIYQSIGTNILDSTVIGQQGLAFHADAAMWGMGILPTPITERHESKARDYFAVRSRFGAKVNTFTNARNAAVTRIWMLKRD